MSRPLRLKFCGHSYHVSSRGDRREAIYEDDEDRERFLEIRGRVTISSSATRRSWSMPMSFCSSAFAISRSIRSAPGCVPIRVSGRGAATGRCWGRSRIRGGWRSAACFAARQASLDGGAVLRAFRHRRAGPAVDLDAVESSGAPRRGCLRQANPGCAAGGGRGCEHTPCATSSASATADGICRPCGARAGSADRRIVACSNAMIAGLTLVATSGRFPA